MSIAQFHCTRAQSKHPLAIQADVMYAGCATVDDADDDDDDNDDDDNDDNNKTT